MGRLVGRMGLPGSRGDAFDLDPAVDSHRGVVIVAPGEQGGRRDRRETPRNVRRQASGGFRATRHAREGLTSPLSRAEPA